MNAAEAASVPARSAFSGALSDDLLTRKMPPMEHSSPREASCSGSPISICCPPRGSLAARVMVDAIAIVAIIAPQ